MRVLDSQTPERGGKWSPSHPELTSIRSTPRHPKPTYWDLSKRRHPPQVRSAVSDGRVMTAPNGWLRSRTTYRTTYATRQTPCAFFPNGRTQRKSSQILGSEVGLHVCRPRNPWCQNDHQGPKTDRKMTARMQTSEVYCWCARCNKHWNITCPKQWTGPCADPKRTESGCELPPKVRPPSPASAEPTEFREPLVKTPVDATTAVLHLLIEETRAQAVMARHAERRTQEYFETLQQGGCHSHTNKSATSGSGQRRGYPSSNGTRPTNAWIGGQT